MNVLPTSNKLFSRAAITFATFLGSPLAGCALLATNYSRLGQPKPARLSVIWGAASTIFLAGLTLFLPKWFPSFAIPAAYTFTIYNLATSLQWRAYKAHIESGEGRASLWAATAVGLAGLLVFLGLFTLVVFLLPEHWFPEEDVQPFRPF
jgi:hypothetical protein